MTVRVATAVFLSVLTGAVLAGAAPLSAAPPEPGDPGECPAGVPDRNEIESEMTSARTLAACGSYGLALEHARRLRDLLDAERKCLEAMRLSGNDDLRAAVERELRRNASARAETQELLRLLRIALGSSRRF